MRTLILAAIIATFSLSTFANDHSKFSEENRHSVRKHLKVMPIDKQNSLHLDEVQMAWAKQIRMDTHAVAEPYLEEMKRLTEEYNQLVATELPDYQALDKNVDKQVDTMEKLSQIRTNEQLVFHNILDDNQFIQYLKFSDAPKLFVAKN